jgi:hypothetical protein
VTSFKCAKFRFIVARLHSLPSEAACCDWPGNKVASCGLPFLGMQMALVYAVFRLYDTVDRAKSASQRLQKPSVSATNRKHSSRWGTACLHTVHTAYTAPKHNGTRATRSKNECRYSSHVRRLATQAAIRCCG